MKQVKPYRQYVIALALLERGVANQIVHEETNSSDELRVWFRERMSRSIRITPVILVHGIEDFVRKSGDRELIGLYDRCISFYEQTKAYNQIRKTSLN